MPQNKHLQFFTSLLYILLAIFALWLFFKYALVWVAPFLLAFVFSRIIDPPVSFFEKKLHCPRPLASILFTLIIYGTIGVLLYFSSAKLIQYLVNLFYRLKDLDVNAFIASFNETLSTTLSRFPESIQTFIYSNADDWISSLVSSLKNLISPLVSFTADIASVFPSTLIFIIASIASTYFISADYYTIKTKLLNLLSDKWRLRLRETKKQISKTFLSYVLAMLLLLLVTFAELSIAFAILRVKNPILIAALVAIIDALPILGTGWVLLPWAIVSILSGNYLFAIGLAVVYGVVVIVRNFIEPKIVGDNIGLHPLATLMAMYVGIKLFGIIGMFLPIPIALIKKFYEWGYFDFLKKQQ